MHELTQIGPQHPKVKQVLAIQRNTAPNPERLIVAEGLWAQDLLLESGRPIQTFLWCPELADRPDTRRRAEALIERAQWSYRVSPKTLARISERDDPDGLVSLAPLPRFEPDALAFGSDALVLVADGMEIPGNLGTLIRTLDACGADALVLTRRRTRLTHPRVFRASQGMVLTLPVLEFERPEDALDWLKRHAFHVYLADTDDARNYRGYDYRGRSAFVLGAERYGIPRVWYDAGYPRVFVPMLGRVDSLNVSISAAVLLYEARAQQAGW